MVIALLISTFTTVFLAELGDKTQLATLAISGSSNRPFAVFLGSSMALVLASFIGATAGGSIATLIPGNVLKLLASLGLLIVGLKILWPLNQNKSEAEQPSINKNQEDYVFLS